MAVGFGTDGVRGHAAELDDEFVFALGRAAVRVLAAGSAEPSGRFVLGRDTRESGPRLERALRAGLVAGGAKPEVLGVVPTPAVAHLAMREGVPGAMISASHNSYQDNGIKFFAAGGLKLSDATERRIEAEFDRVMQGAQDEKSAASTLAAVTGDALDGFDSGRVEQYAQSIVDSLSGRSLRGLSVVVDCANGASSQIAPDVLRRLGAEVTVLHASPDGRNINAHCGSTHPESLQRVVVERGADAGLAFDGDADRVVPVDESGGLVDGDHLIAMCALDLHARNELIEDTVVVTVMTNLGFRLSMGERGIKVVETQVGDRYVLEALDAGGYVIGGEQSGHVIFRKLATTGDGLLTGVQVLDLLLRSGRPLSKLAGESMTQLPQVLKNVRVGPRDDGVAAKIAPQIAQVEKDLGETGRVLVRASGTEAVVRVMIEAQDREIAEAAADRLIAAVTAACSDSADHR